MSFAETETVICNLALQRLGDKTIESLDEDSEMGRTMKLLYTTVRDEELMMHNWSFASARTTLARDTSDPDFEWTYQHILPANFLRMIEIYSPVVDGKFAIEGNKFLSEEETPQVKYIQRVTTTTLFDPLFVKALYIQIAMGGSVNLTSIRERKADLFSEYQLVIAQAMKYNAIGVNLPKRVGNTADGHTWANKGR